jgi:hypothetical protein
MLAPLGRDFGEALFGFVQLVEEPLRLVAVLRLPLVERLARVAYCRLRLPEALSELDRSLVLRHFRLEDARPGVALLPVAVGAAANTAARRRGAGSRPTVAIRCGAASAGRAAARILPALGLNRPGRGLLLVARRCGSAIARSRRSGRRAFVSLLALLALP